MANGLQGLIKKHQEKADEGSFESLMCAFALEMFDVIKDIKDLKDSQKSFLWKMSSIKATVFIFGVMVVNAITATAGVLWILQMIGKI